MPLHVRLFSFQSFSAKLTSRRCTICYCKISFGVKSLKMDVKATFCELPVYLLFCSRNIFKVKLGKYMILGLYSVYIFAA